MINVLQHANDFACSKEKFYRKKIPLNVRRKIHSLCRKKKKEEQKENIPRVHYIYIYICIRAYVIKKQSSPSI